MTTSKRQAVVLVALLLALAPPVRAGDPTAAAFKKQAKTDVKQVKTAAKDALAAIKSGLTSVSDGYAGSGDADAALTQLVDLFTAQRDILEDAAQDAIEGLSAEGLQLLVDGGLTGDPGPDFSAGGRGTWDKALDDVEAILDKADGDMAKAFAKFLKGLDKAAAAQAADIDIRAQLPEHGAGFWGVAPPAAASSGLTEATGFVPPQILIEVRIAETSSGALSRLGARSSAPSLTVLGASTSADEATVATLLPDADGRATGALDLSALTQTAGYVRLLLDDGAFQSAATALSAPSLAAPAAGTQPILDELKADMKSKNKDFQHDSADALKQLTQILASHVKAVKSGAATPELALRTGWLNLRDAREAIGQAWKNGTGQLVDASLSLFLGGFDDGDLSGEFFADSPGVVQTALAKVNKELAQRQDAASTTYEKFATTILAVAGKQDLPVGAAFLIGRTAAFQPQPVTTAETPPLIPFTPPGITDALVLVLKPTVTKEFSVLITVQADPLQFPSLSTSATTLPAGDTSDLASLAPGQGGTATTEVPLLDDIPILGWLFRTKSTLREERSLVILVKPQLVTGE